MCGINGFILSKTDADSAINMLEKMNRCIYHRGPDEDGVFIEKMDGLTVGFAIRRLSIIVLSSGKQPIFSDDRSKTIVFNGEIYNYKTLKRQLQDIGYQFYTASDTEVILKLYEEYGTRCFEMLDGMFDISIYDKSQGKVFIARDFFGEKPLYYTSDSNGLIWCSELKSLMSILDRKLPISITGLNLFFQLTYIPAPFTIYEGVHKLEANHYIEYNLDLQTFDIFKIHNGTEINKKEISFEQAKKEVKSLVEESVISRSVSDVPIGTFLSGGVDSSIVSLCLAQNLDEKINTFSIGFEKKDFDESDKSRTVAGIIGSRHQEFIINENDLSSNLDRILLNFDEPFADSSALPSFLVANKTSEFVKVALTGDGGDELFGGYNKYLMGNINQKYTQLVPESLHNTVKKITDFLTVQKEDKRNLKYKIRKAVGSVDYSNEFYYNIIKLGFSEKDTRDLFKEYYWKEQTLSHYKKQLPKPRTLTAFRNLDLMLSLEGDMIVKVDRTSMLTSLECRAPFLNKKLWDYTMSLPENYLIKGNNKKFILKKAFEQYFPAGFLERSKQGFGVPVGDWLKAGMRKELESYIADDFLDKQSIFHKYYVKKNGFQSFTFC